MPIAKTKLIVCEGPDASGKTSLAKFIANRYGYIYIHMSGHKSLHSGMPAYHNQVVDDIKFNWLNGHGFVMDRCWISEYIYGKLIFKRKFSENFDFLIHSIELDKLQVIYIHCLATLEQFKVDVKDNHGYSIDDFQKIRKEYHAYFQDSDIPQYSISEWGANMTEFCIKYLDK